MLTRSLVFLVLILVMAGATTVALAYGPFPLTVDDVVRATKRLTGDDMGAVTSGEIVFMQVRLPRVAADSRAVGRRRGLPDPVPQSAGVARHPRGRERLGARCGPGHTHVAVGRRHR